MEKLTDYEAFDSLRETLKANRFEYEWCSDSPAIDRLRNALDNYTENYSPLDCATLLRQALLYEMYRRGDNFSVSVEVSHAAFNGFNDWESLGLKFFEKDKKKIISALPWTPQWLLATETGVETYASSENILRKFNSEFCEGDPFLGSVGRTSYRSRAQRQLETFCLCLQVIQL